MLPHSVCESGIMEQLGGSNPVCLMRLRQMSDWVSGLLGAVGAAFRLALQMAVGRRL